MPSQEPEPGDELRLGRRALEGISGVEILDDLRWYESEGRWALRCRLQIDIESGGLVPPVTDWYLSLDPEYPFGAVKLFPAKAGGLISTFNHQSFNEEGSKSLPWRTGKLCLETSVASLGRLGFDKEPKTAARRLVWHIERALDWLQLASSDRLVENGDFFELPQYPLETGPLLVFSETAETLERWESREENMGYVEIASVRGPKALWIAHRFLSRDRRELVSTTWGRYLRERWEAAPLGLWVRVPLPIALAPWQAPATWAELKQSLAEQGCDLMTVVRELGHHLRDHGLPLQARPERPLLLGFPIPERVRGPSRRQHWISLPLPPLAAGNDFANGFKKDEAGYRARDAQALYRDRPIRWLQSECWSLDDRSTRGRLGRRLRHMRVAVLGAGALGSAIAELLVRGGVDSMIVFDPDFLEAGNLVRHTLTLRQLGENKAVALASRLNELSPTAEVEGYRGCAQEAPEKLDEVDLVLDATADDDVLAYLEGRSWNTDRWFVSIWVNSHATQAYCFSVRANSFPAESCRQRFADSRLEEGIRQDPGELPRTGIGCWHFTFAARADDIWLLAACLVKHLDRLIEQDHRSESLALFEQAPGTTVGALVERLR